MRADCCYFGRGRVYFTQPLTANGGVSNVEYNGRAGTNWPDAAAPQAALRMPPGRFVGNARGLIIAPRVQPLDVPDYADGDHPDYIVQGVDISLEMLRAGAANLADAFPGSRSVIAGRQVVETIAASQASVRTDDMLYVSTAIDLTKPVTVQPSWADWNAGADYELEAYGVRMLHGYAGPFGASITITYTMEGGADEMEGLSIRSRSVGIVYVGVNLVTMRPARADLYRVDLQPAERWEPISQQMAVLSMSGTLRPVRGATRGRPRWFRTMNGAPHV